MGIGVVGGDQEGFQVSGVLGSRAVQLVGSRPLLGREPVAGPKASHQSSRFGGYWFGFVGQPGKGDSAAGHMHKGARRYLHPRAQRKITYSKQ